MMLNPTAVRDQLNFVYSTRKDFCEGQDLFGEVFLISFFSFFPPELAI